MAASESGSNLTKKESEKIIFNKNELRSESVPLTTQNKGKSDSQAAADVQRETVHMYSM